MQNIRIVVAYVALVSAVLCFMPLGGQAEDGNGRERILSTFHPYRSGPPQVEGITPGMKIDSTNFQAAQELLPPEILQYVQAGDFAFTTQATTDMPVRENYIEATLQHYAQVGLGDGVLTNYVAGLPFPLIDSQDPQAGEKVAWNHRYRDEGETTQYWPSNEIRSSGGAVERTQRFYFVTMRGMHRAEADKNLRQWEKEGVFSREYLLTTAPSDQEGSQVLTFIYDNDTLVSDNWIYDPQSRRTRKIADNPYDSPGGGVVLMEDRRGFYGYIHPYEWRYLGEKVVLAPGAIKAAEATWGGKGNWYPVDPWELRRAIVLEAIPKQSHPLYSRRILYVDLQTHNLLYTLTYDHNGDHKRTFFLVYIHPKFDPWNNEVGIPLFAAQASLDYRQKRAGIFQTHKVVYNKRLSRNRFSVRGLMLYGK